MVSAKKTAEVKNAFMNITQQLSVVVVVVLV